MLIKNDAEPTKAKAGCFQAYGWIWQSDLPLELFQPLGHSVVIPDIYVRLHDGEQPPERDVIFSNGRATIGAEGFRFRDGRIATMDVNGAKEVAVYPGPEWTGNLPQSFFSTVAGAILALRGGLPIHGSAVEIDGRAVILCGPSGAGKSTLTAALVASGARLISDDLTVIRHVGPGETPAIYSGRRSIRLFAGAALALRDAVSCETIPASGTKQLLVPPRTAADRSVPLAGFILLKEDPFEPESVAPLEEPFADFWFRPRIYSRLPGHTLRAGAFSKIIQRVRVVSAPKVKITNGLNLELLSNGLLSIWQKPD